MDKLEKKFYILNNAFKSLIEDAKKRDDRIDKLEKQVKQLGGRIEQSDKENWMYIKELQDEKHKVSEELKVVEDKLTKIEDEISELSTRQQKNINNESFESKVESNSAMFKCTKCSTKFHDKKNLKHHINTRHPKVVVVCKICDIPFNENHKYS